MFAKSYAGEIRQVLCHPAGRIGFGVGLLLGATMALWNEAKSALWLLTHLEEPQRSSIAEEKRDVNQPR